MITRILVLFALLLLQMPSEAQQNANGFVLDDRNPYVYLKFDHMGARQPFIDGESQSGVWIRIVNNCRVPISVPTAGAPGEKGGIEVLDEVVPMAESAVKVTTDNPEKQQASSQSKRPEGYAEYAGDVQGFTEIAPGESLLFSVPVNHVVGPDWYMRVRFSLDVPGSEHGPYSYVDSFTVQIPPGHPQ